MDINEQLLIRQTLVNCTKFKSLISPVQDTWQLIKSDPKLPQLIHCATTAVTVFFELKFTVNFLFKAMLIYVKNQEDVLQIW